MLKDLTKKNRLNFHDKLNDLDDSEQEIVEDIFSRKLNEDLHNQKEVGEPLDVYGFKNKIGSFLICKEDLRGHDDQKDTVQAEKPKRKRRKSYVEQTPEDYRKLDEEQKLSQKQFREQILFDRKIGHK